jgi:uncharacterized paraquat-inducible protein A
VCFIGRWSMIDFFMESLLGGLVAFGSVIIIEPFGARFGLSDPNDVRGRDL